VGNVGESAIGWGMGQVRPPDYSVCNLHRPPCNELFCSQVLWKH